MKKAYFILIFLFCQLSNLASQHNAGHNGKVLLIASNPSVSKQTGWPIGVWAAEITHPYWEFSNAGYTVDIASPNGGEVVFDGFSDPEDASKYAAWDLISLGFKKDETKMSLLKNTLKLATVNPDDYKAILVCGGQAPMYTFYENTDLHRFFTTFYQTGKPAAAICHGTCILLKTKLPGGKLLVEGKRWTGFANDEENYADAYVGQKIQPFRIEDEAAKLPNSRFETAPMFEPYAVADGNLITGQQQNSGAEAAKLVIQQLEKDKSRYPTYVLVHGAWADESAWGFVRNDLARYANVEVVNLPAHGADNTWGANIGLSDYVKTVTDAIQKYPGKVTLVGHSMAGMVISQVAENLPNKVEKLVYVSAFLPKNGESLNGIVGKFLNGKTPEIFEFNADYTLVAVKKEAIPAVVCADCPLYMKDILVKYHRAEPVKGFNDVVTLGKNFQSVPKFYISTRNDNAVPFALQQQMVKDNGSVKKVHEMNTSHLPFVIQPSEFLGFLTDISKR
jgi:putative intracellular protease/amidase